MPVIIAGIAGARWGLSPESGIIAQRSSTKTHIEENPTKDTNGEFAMTSFYNPTQSITLFGISLGAGLSSALVGTALAIQNLFSGNGVSAGGSYLIDIEQSYDNTGFLSVMMNLVRRPLIS